MGENEKKIQVFLASTVSGEFEVERLYFLSEIKEYSEKEYQPSGINIIPLTSDNMGKFASKKGTQPRYNQAIQNSRLVVFLVGEHLGAETRKEFEKANRRRRRTGKLSICVYFKKDAEADKTVTDFRKSLEKASAHEHKGIDGDRGVYFDEFSNKDDLLHKIERELRICLEPDRKAAGNHASKAEKTVYKRAFSIGIVVFLLSMLSAIGFGKVLWVDNKQPLGDFDTGNEDTSTIERICFWESEITLAPGASMSVDDIMGTQPKNADPADIDYSSSNRAVAYVKPLEPGKTYRTIVVPADWTKEDGLYADITAGSGVVESIHLVYEPDGGVRVEPGGVCVFVKEPEPLSLSEGKPNPADGAG